jgi:ferredoxin
MANVVIDLDGLQRLVDVLRADGYVVFAPVVRDGGIVPAPVTAVDELPRGVLDEQAPGHYRLGAGGDALFGFAATATSWKSLLFPARRALWRLEESAPVAAAPDETRRALLGVRSCDLAAIAVHDAVLSGRRLNDPDYVARRERTFVIPVTCGKPASTCFCTSMGTGPTPSAGYDLALTELHQDGEHRFVVEVGSDAGAAVLAQIPSRPSDDGDRIEAQRVVDVSIAAITRRVDTDGIRDLLYDNAEHPEWDDVAGRCLGCTNCTLACPTCFCVTTEDVMQLTEPVGRDRVWDSCFNADHSYLHGGPVRQTTHTRYRQWLTHKFGSWIDQFGSSGCVGCGRCIAWCPVGIDVTAELAALRSAPEETP